MCENRLKTAWLVWLAGASAAFAAQDGRELALSLAREGRCEVALIELGELASRAAPDAEVERLTGECALRLQRFELAAQALENARRVDPDAPRLDLHLAMARFHLGDLAGAHEALARAERRGDAESAEFLLYSGLIALDRQQFEAAARRFDAASQLSDRAPEPMATFYLGRSLSELDDLAAAGAAFDRVIRDHPGTSWSAEAERARERLRAAERARLWASAELGFEYDDNVLLRGRGVGLPSEISGQSDERWFWFADAGVLKRLARQTDGGASLRYAGSAHHDLDEFDTQAPGLTLWIDRALGDGADLVRLQYDIDAAFIDEDPFVLNQLVTGSFVRSWGRLGQTILAATYAHDQYYYDRFDVEDANPTPPPVCPTQPLCGPIGLDEKRATNRTGDGVGATLAHQVPLTLELGIVKDPWMSGAYGYNRYWARGPEYDQRSHQIEVEAGIGLPFSVAMTVGGRFAYRAFDNSTVFPDPAAVPAPVAGGARYALRPRDRRERETGVWVRLTRPITDSIVVTASFRRTRNRSNAEVFDYDRNLYGLSMRIGFGG